MNSSFSTVSKNKLVSSFTNIEFAVLKAIDDYENTHDKEKLNREFGMAMQLLSGFAKNLSEAISLGFAEGIFYEPYLYCDKEVAQEMQSVLRGIIQLLIELMDKIAKTIEAELDEESILFLRHLLGELSLSIRFDIVSLPETVIEGKADIGNIYAQLNRINIHNNDHIVVKNLWQNSGRRRLPIYSAKDVAIVMQGPVDYERNFTLETLMRYKRIYPDAMIILSTWYGEVNDDLRHMLRAIDIEIVENDIPINRGPSNIACQLDSSLFGIERAKENGDIKYILKTRTDQAFYLPEFLLYFRNMLRTYPVNNENMQARLIFLGTHGSMCNYPFRITDFMTFGDIEDVTKLYEAPKDFERLEYTQSDSSIKKDHYYYVIKRALDDSFFDSCNMDEASRRQVVDKIGKTQDPESFLIQSFCERIVYGKNITSDDDALMLYWRFIKNCAIFIDPDELLFFWDKYGSKYIDISSNVSEGGLTHAAWMSFYYWDI